MNDQPELERRPLGTCGNCFFAYVGPLDPQTFKRARYCKMMPPSASMLMSNQGAVQVSLSPPVNDTEWCWQWRSAEETGTEKLPKSEQKLPKSEQKLLPS